ncbi:MAG: proton-conducting transporter membrane subunit [Actinomycetota bacterium]|nr:proton-conducting transporter membrane subunit [Actinomycetota bacterium]
MTESYASGLFVVSVLAHYPFALLVLLSSKWVRLRRFLVVIYLIVISTLMVLLLNGFLVGGRTISWGQLSLSSRNFLLYFIVNLLTCASLVFFEFGSREAQKPHILCTSIITGGALTSLLFLVSTLTWFSLILAGVTISSFFGILSDGLESLRLSIRSFSWWIASDVLFFLGVLLCRIWLNENSVFINPPLLRGTELQVLIVVVLFLLSAMMRLAMFPFTFWLKDISRKRGPAWNVVFLCSSGFAIGAYRLLVSCVMAERLLYTNVGGFILALGLLSCIAGPVMALRSTEIFGMIQGFYTFEGGLLLTALGQFSRASIEGAYLIIVSALLSLSALFMSCQTGAKLSGTASIEKSKLRVACAPALSFACVFSLLSIMGVPLLSGFPASAFTALSSLDIAAESPFYVVVAIVIMASILLVAYAALRFIFTFFSREGTGVTGKPRTFEGLVPLSICAFSLIPGVFPVVLIRNFIKRASFEAFPSVVSAHGIVFRADSPALNRSLQLFRGWPEIASVFLLCVAGASLIIYFAGERPFRSKIENASRRSSDWSRK